MEVVVEKMCSLNVLAPTMTTKKEDENLSAKMRSEKKNRVGKATCDAPASKF